MDKPQLVLMYVASVLFHLSLYIRRLLRHRRLGLRPQQRRRLRRGPSVHGDLAGLLHVCNLLQQLRRPSWHASVPWHWCLVRFGCRSTLLLPPHCSSPRGRERPGGREQRAKGLTPSDLFVYYWICCGPPKYTPFSFCFVILSHILPPYLYRNYTDIYTVRM
ncbi:hypothetical protein BS78_08G154600 [Paspalum vaginatum]|nr:hypothetical protein BS78_08G154600 [Paspalum vaginatum]